MKHIFLMLAVLTSLTFFACNTEAQKGAAPSQDGDSQLPTDDHLKPQAGSIHLTKAEFLKRVVDYESNPNEWNYLGDKPAIVDFYADWCRPCKIAGPILDELAKEYDGKLYVYKVNTETEQELAGAFGISSIPAFLFIPMQGDPQMAAGIARTPEETKQMFKSMIADILKVE